MTRYFIKGPIWLSVLHPDWKEQDMKMFIDMIQQNSFPEQKEESPEIPEIFEAMARNWRMWQWDGSPCYLVVSFHNWDPRTLRCFWKTYCFECSKTNTYGWTYKRYVLQMSVQEFFKRRLSTRPWQVPRWCQVTGMGRRIVGTPLKNMLPSHAWSFPNSHEQPSKTKGLV